MKRIAFVFAVVSTTTFSASPARAGFDYRCTIERVHDADGERSSLLESHRKLYVGKEFTVDRRSGVMVGILKNAYVTEPVVIDRGSNVNSFKAVTTMRRDQGAGAGSSVFTLVVNEYVDSPKKPFAFLSDDTVFFGNCDHF